MKRPDRHAREDGFALVETLVSAVLVVVIALATLAGVDRAQSTAANSRARSVAAQLAEQDQERMRAMPASALSNYHPSSQPPVTVGGLTYNVASRADWVRDATGATQSCTNDSTQASYLRITSTVTSSGGGNGAAPVSINSIVAPPVGFGDNQGTLAVKITDSRDQPVVGQDVSISGGRSMTDATNSAGCAVFAYLPMGNYRIIWSKAGWVDTTNRSLVDFTVSVPPGVVTVASRQYDRAASVGVSFETWVSGAAVPSTGWGATASSTVSGGGSWSYDATSPPQATVPATSLFPSATSAYEFYAGECAGANPETAIPQSTWFSTLPGSTDVLAPLPGSTNGAVTVRQPPLTLTVRTGSTTAIPNANIVLTPKDTACTKLQLTTDASGRAAKSATGAYDPGIPFGKYDVCVDATWKPTASTTVHKRWASATASPLNMTAANGPNNAPGTTSGVLDLNASGTTTPAVCAYP